MQVFEFHFNPKTKDDLIFDSFCYEPENIYEKRVGNLYMVGFLKNVLPQNFKFLDKLAKVIKEKYYGPMLHSPEKQLKESLRAANEFLENIAKSGDVSWLGNLSFVTLSLTPHQKSGGGELNFTKVGDSKIFLLREGQIIDIDQELRFQEIEPYPLKIFGNIISGKLAENDLILVLTKEVLDYFTQKNLLDEIAKLLPPASSADEPKRLIEERKLKEIFNTRKDELLKISGICLLIFLSEEILAKKRGVISPPPEKFSLKQIFSPIAIAFKGIIKKPRLRLSTPVFGGQAKFLKRVVGGWRPKIEFPKLKIKLPSLNKNLILVLALIFFLLLGFFIFQKEKEQQLKEYQTVLDRAQEKVLLAESFLIFENEEEANSLFQEAWEEILPLTKIATSRLWQSSPEAALKADVIFLKESIEKNLGDLNKLKIIETPELLFEFNRSEFIPQKMIILDGFLYFFNPYSQNLFKVSNKGEGQIIPSDKKFNLATSLTDSILFFLKPDKLIGLKEGQFRETFSLELPQSDSNFNAFVSYHSNLYFFDTKRGEIVKYPYLGGLKWGPPQLWLNPETKKATEAKSMAIDGSIWLLTPTQKDGGGSIDRYYAGNFQATLELKLFPYPKNFSKIFTSPALPYLYLLESEQSRIIIIDKTGEIVQQFQSEKFNNLLDFSISEDGKTIYLLNGLKVYRIEI